MDPGTLSSVAWALATTQKGSPGILKDILWHTQRKTVSFTPSELTTLLWAAATYPGLNFATIKGPYNALLHLLNKGMRLDAFSTHDLSLLVWAAGKASYLDGQLIAATVAECTAKAAEFSPADAARAMQGFSMLHHAPAELLACFGERWTERMNEFGPEELTTFMQSIGDLSMDPGIPFMKATVRRAMEMTTAATTTKKSQAGKPPTQRLLPHQLLAIMKTISKLHFKFGAFSYLHCAMEALTKDMTMLSAADVNVALEALVTLDITVSDAALAAAARRLQEVLATDPPSEIALALKHLTALNQRHLRKESLLSQTRATEAFARAAVGRLAAAGEQLSGDELAGVVISMSSLQLRASAPQQRQLSKACAASAVNVSPHVLPELLWAVLHLGWADTELPQAVAHAASGRVVMMSPDSLVKTAWTVAGQANPYPYLVTELGFQCVSRLQFFSVSDRARLCCAFGYLLDKKDRRYCKAMAKALNSTLSSFSNEEVRRLDRAAVFAVVWSCRKLQGPPRTVLEQAAKRITTLQKKFSAAQLRYVVEVLAQHGCEKLLLGREASSSSSGSELSSVRVPTQTGNRVVLR